MPLTPAQKMYNRGARASMSSDDSKDLSYWDARLGSDPLYSTAFLDGWTDAATGENAYRHLYF